MNWSQVWAGFEKVHNVQAVGESMGKLFEHLNNWAQKINLIRPEEEQKFLNASRNVIGRVVAQAAFAGIFPLLRRTVDEMRRVPITAQGQRRKTKTSEEKFIDAVKNLAILRSEMKDEDVHDYEIEVNNVLEWVEQVLEDSQVLDVNGNPTGEINYTAFDSIIDLAVADRFTDAAAAVAHWIGYYFPWLCDRIGDRLVPPLKRIRRLTKQFRDRQYAEWMAKKDFRPFWTRIFVRRGWIVLWGILTFILLWLVISGR
jgi:hypothetical protein